MSDTQLPDIRMVSTTTGPIRAGNMHWPEVNS